MTDQDFDSPGYMPLLPRHKVYLFRVGGDGKCFVDNFRKTWSVIPLRDRKKLLKHWRSLPSPVVVNGKLIGYPSVELIPYKSDYFRGNSGEAIAQYKHFRCSFSFCSTYTDLLPAHAVQSLIAHELAHAICYLEEAESHCPEHLETSWPEEDADEVATFWGFDCDQANEAIQALTDQLDKGISEGSLRPQLNSPSP